MRFFTLFLLLLCGELKAQVCSGQGRTPQTAIALCGTSIFTQASLPNCTGQPIPFIGCVSGLNSSRSEWYKFHCYQSGTLGFLITPLATVDDYDWALMDITGKSPQDVFTQNLITSINLSGLSGTTGCNIDGIGSVNCPGSVKYNDMPALIVGHDYLLMVTNFTNSGLGYTISFEGGTAVLTDNLLPSITSVKPVNCNTSKINIRFSEDILCSSLSGAAEFFITNGAHTISAVTSDCSTGQNTIRELTLDLQAPLAGGNYDLIINNGTDGNTLQDICSSAMPVGYSFPFEIMPQTPVTINEVLHDPCNPSMLKLVFNKPVLCSTISGSASEFSIVGWPVLASLQSVCNGRNYEDTIVLSFQSPLPPGNLQLQVNAGADGNIISDTCGVFMPVSTFPFVVTTAPAPAYDSLQYEKCAPSQIKIFYSKAIKCNSINPNGSEFSITGPIPVAVSSVSTQGNCSNGYTNWIILNLSQPINQTGTFVLHNVAGSDGNSVMDTCFASQDVNETFSFNVFYKPSAVFEDSVHFGCVMDTLVVSHPGGNGINSWQWTFSDGTVLTGPSVLYEFPVATVTASVQLIVSNGTCSDTLSRNYTLNNAFAVGFSINKDTVCSIQAITVNNTTSGNNLNYTWDFGDGTTFSGQHPVPHLYATPGDYSVSLSVNDNYGCAGDSIKNVHIAESPIVRFTGLATPYCSIDTIRLSAQLTGDDISSYTWNNGNGTTISNEPQVRFIYTSQGNYTITLTVADRFCDNVSFSQSVQIFKQPVVNLGKDLRLCPEINKEIGVDPVLGYSYLWNNGATTSKIITGPSSFNYRLSVNNNNCITQDEIFVVMQDTCMVKIPNAFTPNNDGLNDQLKAINAELAKDFWLRVYNRFGQLVYSTRISTDGWDGRVRGQPAEPGTYVWQVSYIHPYNGLPVYEKGTSILIW